jgi:hypothetical protein
MNLDEYQIQHAKNFRYRYYPPRLVELERQAQGGEHTHGDYVYDSNYPDNMEPGETSAPIDDRHYKSASSKAGATLIKWAIVLLVLLLALFLIMGVVSMSSSSVANNAKSSGGGWGFLKK